MELMITPVAVFVIENGKIKEKIEICKKKDPKECAKAFLERKVDEIKEQLIKKYGKIEEVPMDPKILIKEGYFKNEEELNEFLNKFGIEMTKKKIKGSYTPDRLIIQAVDFIDDLNEMINKFYERLMEWYGIYFPEFVKKVDDLEKFFKILSEEIERDKVAKKVGIKEESMGYDFTEEDLEVIREVVEKGKALLDLKKRLTKYIKAMMEEHYPNFTKLAGPLVGAKLISLAGGVDSLVRLPASTIQVLGAEKALFRHLTKGTKPPKHGILFQHPLVNRQPKKLRGKVARTLAAKLAIAIKVDYYSKGKEIVWEKLQEELEERIKELKEKGDKE